MIFKIRPSGAAVLRQKAQSVTVFDDSLRRLAKCMRETLRHYRAIGLAANQIGKPIRLAYLQVAGYQGAVANPVFSPIEGAAQESAKEGCLSCLGADGGFRTVSVYRWTAGVLTGSDEHGAPIKVRLAGLSARAAQHEIDHLDGILISDLRTDAYRG